MTYRVIILPPAAEELDQAYRWIARRSVQRVNAWFQGAERAYLPCLIFRDAAPLAPENDTSDVEVRQLLHGDFRFLFTIDDDTVLLLHVRHGSRRRMTPDELA